MRPPCATAFFLLRTGCQMNHRLGTPLIAAAREGHTADIQRMIREGADPNESAGVNNWTPLMHAIHKN